MPADENSQHWTRLDHPFKVEIAGSNPARVTSKSSSKPEPVFGFFLVENRGLTNDLTNTRWEHCALCYAVPPCVSMKLRGLNASGPAPGP